jgi:hypothetical protein
VTSAVTHRIDAPDDCYASNRNTPMKYLLPFLIALCLYITSASAADQSVTAAITLNSPSDYQVFQRQTRAAGRIVVEGSVNIPAKSTSAKPDRLQARVMGNSLSGEWQALPFDARVPRFRGEVSVPVGGWYRLDVRLSLGEQVLAEVVVEHFGVGEVFVIAGQSNSGNYGSEKQTTQTGLVSAFSGTGWQLADDPQPGAGGGGGSFMPAFGDRLAEQLKLPIGLVATGIGATSIREWLPRGTPVANPPTLTGNVVTVGPERWEAVGNIFAGFTTRLKQLGPNGFRAVLWHQGESDANQASADRTLSGENYRRYLELLIRATRKEVGWDMPWFVAQASYHSESDPGSPDIREAQKALWASGVAFEGPDTDSLRAEYRSGVHFNGEGLRKHGRMWADKVGPWLEQWLSEQPSR